MSRETNIVWINRLAWAHALMGIAGTIKFGGEGELFWSGAWLTWANLCVAFAMTSPRRVIRKRGEA